MRYTPEHKQATRGRIMAAAGRLFRRHGYEATGVDAIMAEAGLTPGGFYAHFAGKEALLVETLSRCLGESAAKVAWAAGSSREPFGAMVSRYLCSVHRDDPEDGCPLPSLAAEVSRLKPGARRAFTAALERYLTNVESYVPGATAAKRRERALATLSTLVGAMTLARAVSDGALSRDIFEAARHTLLASSTSRAAPKPAKNPVRTSDQTSLPARRRAGRR